MCKLHTRFQSETVLKPYPLGRHTPGLNKGVPPPRGGLEPSVRESRPFFLSVFVNKMWRDNETMLDDQTVDILKGIIMVITYISKTRELLKRMGGKVVGARLKRGRNGYGWREF